PLGHTSTDKYKRATLNRQPSDWMERRSPRGPRLLTGSLRESRRTGFQRGRSPPPPVPPDHRLGKLRLRDSGKLVICAGRIICSAASTPSKWRSKRLQKRGSGARLASGNRREENHELLACCSDARRT